MSKHDLDLDSYLADLAERQSRVWPAGTPRSPLFPIDEQTTVVEHLEHWADTQPDVIALVFYGCEITFRRLNEMADRYAGWLEARGVAAGDRVGVMLPNCPQLTIAMFAAWKLNAIHVPVNPMFRETELRHELGDAGVAALLYGTDLAALVEPVAEELGVQILARTRTGEMASTDAGIPLPSVVADTSGATDWPEILATEPAPRRTHDINAVATLNYTGGTTGLPKGCEHTQWNMLYKAATTRTMSTAVYADGVKPVGLMFVPAFWIGGTNATLLHIVFGTKLVMLTRWDAKAVLVSIERYGVTEMAGTVDNYVELLERDDLDLYDLSSLRSPMAMSFVRKLTVELRQQWADRVGAGTLRETAYGMTETHTMDTLPVGFSAGNHDLSSSAVFVGLPVPGTEVAVVDEESLAPVALGERGAILLRTPSAMKGYWNAPEATRAAFADGWFRTGDRGFLDEDGCLYYLGRDKDMIKVNGMSVFPSELETILARHQDIETVAVVAMPDAARGERPLAFVQLTEGADLSAEDLAAWARTRMAVYKVPVFSVVEGFPMTDTGKIRKVELARRAATLAAAPDLKGPQRLDPLSRASADEEAADPGDQARLLVANRGEIALRVIRAARALGITTVAVHPADDALSPHVVRADESVELPGTGASAYLDVTSLVRIATASGCTMVHPGYGFLSESEEFARACEDAGVRFIGPTPETIGLFGDKVRARMLAESLSVPLLNGTRTATTKAEMEDFVRHVVVEDGGRAIIKAVSGGGGRGMRVVDDPSALTRLIDVCRQEAKSSSGDDALYIEQMLPVARHIEVQVIGDGTGAVSHLWDRDCSLQRRHQKLVEIAPAVGVPEESRAGMLAAAKSICAEVAYRGIATVEFLLAPGGQFYFMEVNPRVQVEHTVTEEVLDVDVVQAQIRVCTGSSLAEVGLTQSEVPSPQGVAIEMRVNAETITADGTVIPQSGSVAAVQFGTGRGVRVDTATVAGGRVSANYDSLVAKCVVHDGDGFAGAWRLAADVLSETSITGVETNVGFLRAVLAHPALGPTTWSTRWVDEHMEPLARRTAELNLRSTVLTGVADTTVPAVEAVPMDDSRTAIRAAMDGMVVSLLATAGDKVARGQELAVVEAMKMQHPVVAESHGTVAAGCVKVGDSVSAGQVLFVLDSEGPSVDEEDTTTAHNLDEVRPDLAHLLERKGLLEDEQRPDAVAKRHTRGNRTARENIADLVDPGSFIEYGGLAVAAQRSRTALDDLIRTTPADGIITGLARVNGDQFETRSACAVLAYDYTVMAGTQGYHNHLKTDRLLEVAKRRSLPVVLFAEGGGGRPGDVDIFAVGGLGTRTFTALAEFSGRTPTIGIANGRCFAGNAALLGTCDVIIATENANIGMGGPVMIEGGGLGVHAPEEIGPTDVQARSGVVDLRVADEAEAVAVAKRYLSYFQGDLDPAGVEVHDQRRLRHLIPQDRKRAYDIRGVVETLCDIDSVLELRPEFGRTILTALGRIDGKAVGIVANVPTVLGGAIDADGADKTARFMQLCDSYGIPIVSLCDTPGFMVGPDSEAHATVRHFGRLFLRGAFLSTTLVTVVLRKGYGLGAMAMLGGNMHQPTATLSWPTGEFGGMGLEGAVRLGFRKELERIEAAHGTKARDARYDELVAEAYERGRAINAAMLLEIDDVIDPALTRENLSRLLVRRTADSWPHGTARSPIDAW